MSNETMIESAVSADHEAEIEEIVKTAMVAASNKPNTPPDGGWGYEDPAKEPSSDIASFLLRTGARVIYPVPYAGDEQPTIHIEQPIDPFWLNKPA